MASGKTAEVAGQELGLAANRLPCPEETLRSRLCLRRHPSKARSTGAVQDASRRLEPQTIPSNESWSSRHPVLPPIPITPIRPEALRIENGQLFR